MSCILIEQESGIEMVSKVANVNELELFAGNLLHKYLGLDEVREVMNGENVRGYSINRTNHVISIEQDVVVPGILWNDRKKIILARVIHVDENICQIPNTVFKTESKKLTMSFVDELNAKIKEGKIILY